MKVMKVCCKVTAQLVRRACLRWDCWFDRPNTFTPLKHATTCPFWRTHKQPLGIYTFELKAGLIQQQQICILAGSNLHTTITFETPCTSDLDQLAAIAAAVSSGDGDSMFWHIPAVTACQSTHDEQSIRNTTKTATSQAPGLCGAVAAPWQDWLS